jgi:hypothetical protein
MSSITSSSKDGIKLRPIEPSAATSTISGNAPPRFDSRAFPYWKTEFAMYCMGKNAAELALRNVRPIRIQGRKAHEPDPEFSPIFCRFLSPEEPSPSRSQPSS